MQLFSADATIFLKKILFFAPENMKKTAFKVARNQPRFFSVLVQLPKRPKNRNPIPSKAP
jgi:hypothetical protein